jgi:peroxiredoxin
MENDFPQYNEQLLSLRRHGIYSIYVVKINYPYKNQNHAKTTKNP